MFSMGGKTERDLSANARVYIFDVGEIRLEYFKAAKNLLCCYEDLFALFSKTHASLAAFDDLATKFLLEALNGIRQRLARGMRVLRRNAHRTAFCDLDKVGKLLRPHDFPSFKWCCNPESQLAQPQIAYNIEKCIGDVCMMCGRVCPNHNIALMDTNKVWINHDNCVNCLACANVCPADAIIKYGDYRTADEVLRYVERDMMFYNQSDGGLTLSGGEPLMQRDFVLGLLREARKRGISCAIETCGVAPWDQVSEIFGLLDYVNFDIKSLNAEKHKEWTGWDTSIILDTFKKFRETYPNVQTRARTPIVPGFNDTEEDIIAIRDFVKQFPNTEYEVLHYHRYGSSKYTFIGREYELGEVELDDDLFAHLKSIAMQSEE